SVDEVGETTRLERLKNFAEGNCSFDDVLSDFVDEYVEAVNSNKPWSWENNIFNGAQISKGQRAKIKNMAFESGYLPKVTVTPVEGMRFGFADFKGAGLVEEAVDLPKDLWLKSDAEQFKWLDEQIGGSHPGMTWHHTEIPGKMELVPTGIHNIITHNGGRSPGMWGYGPR
ncbi:TPA: HNH endonuclease, partial [Streptococcus suis]